MIYYCADDYGLNEASSERIVQCIEDGVLNKVSVFANLEHTDLHKLPQDKPLLVSLHLNLVEGKCLAKPEEIPLLADKNGCLRHAFGGLLKLSLLHRKAFEAQVYKEVKAQVEAWKRILPQGTPFCIDSHQHTYMIPSVFKMVVQVLKEENVAVQYMRIPAEPLLPFIQTPSLYGTYTVTNLIKQWLLKFFWLIDKPMLKEFPVPTAYFFGILFSGKMDAERVLKVLPKYIKLAKKRGRDVEVLFHPAYLAAEEADFEGKNIAFPEFYLSKNRKTEFEAVMTLAKGSVP